jgi:hypothetical protein
MKNYGGIHEEPKMLGGTAKGASLISWPQTRGGGCYHEFYSFSMKNQISRRFDLDQGCLSEAQVKCFAP